MGLVAQIQKIFFRIWYKPNSGYEFWDINNNALDNQGRHNDEKVWN